MIDLTNKERALLEVMLEAFGGRKIWTPNTVVNWYEGWVYTPLLGVKEKEAAQLLQSLSEKLAFVKKHAGKKSRSGPYWTIDALLLFTEYELLSRLRNTQTEFSGGTVKVKDPAAEYLKQIEAANWI